ncbi:MAG: integrin alpha, partial [Planctomycetota bacterium]|nr:integrin alpha [Planctomycetota bacterium]
VDGDGLSDLLIGAYSHDDGGAAYLIMAASLGSDSEIDLSDADYALIGEGADDWAGYHVASAGDVDGDGLNDLLIGTGDRNAITSAGLDQSPILHGSLDAQAHALHRKTGITMYGTPEIQMDVPRGIGIPAVGDENIAEKPPDTAIGFQQTPDSLQGTLVARLVGIGQDALQVVLINLPIITEDALMNNG